MLVDKKQQILINLALVGVGLAGAVISALIYYDNVKHAKLRDQVAVLDKEIKTIELELKKDEARHNGIL